MFDSNHIDDFDQKIRAILENGQEEVPSGVWEGISSGLDKAAQRKSVVLWIGRVGAVAAAAAVIAGVFFIQKPQEDIVPATGEGLIAVVETENTKHETAIAEVSTVYMTIAAVEEVIATESTQENRETGQEPKSEPEQQQSDLSQREETAENTAIDSKAVTYEGEETAGWETDTERHTRKIRTSVVISGIAGTNSPNMKGRLNPFMSPAKNKVYTATTVEQTSAQTTYGIPLSVGMGVKLNFTPKWSLGAGINYTLLTSKFNGKYIKVLEDGTQDPAKYANIRNLQHYVGIPINVYYNIVSREYINFYAYAGGAVEKCVMNSYEILTSPTIHHSETVKGVQLSANAGIGVEFLIGKYVGLYLDPSLRYYFGCGQPKSIRSAQPLMLGFEMGLRFNL